MTYLVVTYLYVSFSGLITSVGEERARRGFLVLLVLVIGLCYFIVALHGLTYNYFTYLHCYDLICRSCSTRISSQTNRVCHVRV